MKLHYDPISTTSRPVMVLAHELGLQLELAPINLFADEHKAAAFAALNPNRAVPVLEDGDFVLTEGSAILKFLAEGQDFYPAEPRARAQVNQLMDWFNTGFYRDFGYGLVYAQTLPDYRLEGAVQAENLRRAEVRSRRWLDVLDQYWLGRSTWLCGDAPTIADFLGGAYVTLGDWIGYDLSPYPNLVRWLDALRARPSWIASHAGWADLVAMLRQAEAA